MAELRTVLTDDDGDGFYDDVHVVNVVENSYSHARPTHYHDNHDNSHKHYDSSSSPMPKIFSTKTKLKIVGITCGILFSIACVAPIFIIILLALMR